MEILKKRLNLKQWITSFVIIGIILVGGYGIYKITRNINKVNYYTDAKDLVFKTGSENYIPVTVQNRNWKKLATDDNYFLAYHLLDSNGNIVTWDGGLNDINIPARARSTVNLKVVAPETPGDYIVSVDLLWLDNQWYSACGNPTLDIPISVKTKPQMKGDIEIERIKQEISAQNQIDIELLSELESDSYTFEDPLVVLNPYGNSPLTAVIIYTSKEAEKVSIYIPGKDTLTSVDHAFPQYNTRHMIPVYGLYADTVNNITLTAETEKGAVKTKELTIITEPLIADLKNAELSTYIGDASKYEPGFNFSYNSLFYKSYKMAFDANGDIRWYFNEARGDSSPANYNGMKSIFMLGTDSYTIIQEYNPLGKVLNVWDIGSMVHHDIELSKDGNLLLTTNEYGSNTYEDEILEIDYETGKVLNRLQYKNILQKTRDNMYGYTNSDWLHMNSIVEHESDLIVSGNMQSTIVKNDRNGNIKWILSDPTGYLSPWTQYLLTPIGKEFEYSYNQHAVEVLPDYDNDPDTVDIILFDNGTGRKYVKNSLIGTQTDDDSFGPELYSRLVHYRVHEKNMTVEQIWEYGKERPELYSRWRGDADLLSNGNIFGTFNRENKDGSRQDTVYIEVDRDKNVIWECNGSSNLVNNNYQDYRCERLKIYSNTAEDLKVGQQAVIKAIQ